MANRTKVITTVRIRIPGGPLAPPSCSRCRHAAQVRRISASPNTNQAAAEAATPNQSRPGATWSVRFVMALDMRGKVWNHVKNEDDKYPYNVNEVPIERNHLVRPKGCRERTIPRKESHVGEKHQPDDDVRRVKGRQSVKNR